MNSFVGDTKREVCEVEGDNSVCRFERSIEDPKKILVEVGDSTFMCIDSEKSKKDYYRFSTPKSNHKYQRFKTSAVDTDVPSEDEVAKNVDESDSFKAAKEKYREQLTRSEIEIPLFELENPNLCTLCGDKSNKEFNCIANGLKYTAIHNVNPTIGMA